MCIRSFPGGLPANSAGAFRSRLLLLSLLLTLLASGSVEPPQYRVDAWTTDNGLPDNSIKALCQTRDGYLWMTTSDGLVRFDGVNFRVFNTANTPGLRTNYYTFYALMEDREGALWAGTTLGGLVRYDNGRFTTYTTRDGLPDNTVLRIDEDEHGTVWIYTPRGLACWQNGRIAPVSATFESIGNHLDSPDILGVDRIFFGLWRLDSSGWCRFAYGQWTQLPFPPQVTDPRQFRIRSLIEDGKHRLWFSLTGIPNYMYGITDGRLASFATVPDCYSVYQDRKGHTIVADRNKSRIGLGKDGKVTWLNGISTPSIFRVLEDREGQLWIGTRDEGLYRVTEQVMTLHNHPGGPQFSAGRVLLRDRAGDVWFGGTGGLARYRNGRFQNYYRPGSLPQQATTVVTALHEDEDGTLWVGFLAGVARFKNGRFIEQSTFSTQIKHEVYAIHRDRCGDLWIGGSDGLWRFRNGRLERYDAGDKFRGATIRTIFEDSAGTLWFGTDSGLLHLSSGGLVSFTAADGLFSGAVVALHEDGRGILWAGTNDNGLTRLAPDGNGVKLTRYTVKDGLYSNSVCQILEDDAGFFWISSRLGIYRVRKQDLDDFAAGRLSQIVSTHFNAGDFVDGAK